MHNIPFLGRQSEMTSLNNRWKDNNPEFIVIYGRRRVGKSELIDRFLDGKLVFACLQGKSLRNFS